MTQEVPSNFRPGCFGSPMAFKAESVECSTCPFAASCAPESARRSTLLREVLQVEFYTPRERQKRDHTPHFAKNGQLVSRAAEATLKRIDASGIRVGEALKEKRNPFGKGFSFLCVACHVLLKLPNGIDQKQLALALETKLGQSSETAARYAICATQVLCALNVARFDNNRLRLL